jgi:purine-binding chemotaxis protein CheW
MGRKRGCVVEERTDAKAKLPKEKPELEEFLIFMVQGKYYTFPSKLIAEVAALEKVFPLPLLPDYVRGIINRYSVPYALIDIGLLILKTPSEKPAKTVVLKETVDKLAFLIDDVVDIVETPLSELLKVERDAEDAGVTGLIEFSFEWHDTHVFCLNLPEIINQIKKDFEG